jgi:Flp pilus assembly protein TadG
MRIVRRPRHAPAPAMSDGPDGSPAERGQSLVEFALVMIPLFVILLGIIQFGFIFNAYITLTNATREGGRTGTIYIAQQTSKSINDSLRNAAIRTSVRGSMNLLNTNAPNFATTTTWTQSGDTYTNGDLVVTYSNPGGVPDTTSRVGQQVTVRATYHQDLIIPMIAQLLPRDANGRLGLTGEITMVIN